VNWLDVSGLVKTLGDPGSGPAEAAAALRGVSFSVARGECLGLKGATGAGKSTLLRIIAGLLAPDAGEVWLDGELMSSSDVLVPPARRQIGFVFQNLGLWPHLTVRGHLDFVLAASCMSRSERAARRAAILDTFVLEGLEQRYPSELSGGERHLLAIARAFCGDARLLLLDEPFTGLDGALKDRILDTLKKERVRRNLTTVLVTHDDDEMRTICQRTEQLSEGRIVERMKQHGVPGDR